MVTVTWGMIWVILVIIYLIVAIIFLLNLLLMDIFIKMISYNGFNKKFSSNFFLLYIIFGIFMFPFYKEFRKVNEICYLERLISIQSSNCDVNEIYYKGMGFSNMLKADLLCNKRRLKLLKLKMKKRWVF